MKFSTPYRLTSFLVRNGLNGRINNWAIVKGEDDKWYRSYQMENKEVRTALSLRVRADSVPGRAGDGAQGRRWPTYGRGHLSRLLRPGI